MTTTDKQKQLTWLKNSLKVNKLRIDEAFNNLDLYDTRQVIDLTRSMIDKAKASIITSANHALTLSPSTEESCRLSKIQSIIEGLNQTLSSPQARKMAYEYAATSKDLVLEMTDIACNAYDRALGSL